MNKEIKANKYFFKGIIIQVLSNHKNINEFTDKT